ncbi:nuclear transport factor 2 family protein [Cryptosporangium sp. NPDC051539]|uniref:nuclear transport factor 2 family protein n=1 Tax=Cryptosporangium sp. NPDC051539 TaxID=3363962 RepID=UPI00379E4C1B
MSRNVAAIFAAIDSFDPDQFVAHLTEDVVFVFGNGEPVVGRAAVRDAVAGFFSTIDGLSHRIVDRWDLDGDTIVRIDVEYTRKDGKHVTVPNADILAFEGDLVRHWQIYIDLAPVFA